MAALVVALQLLHCALCAGVDVCLKQAVMGQVELSSLPEDHWLLARPMQVASMASEFGWRAAPLPKAISSYMAWLKATNPSAEDEAAVKIQAIQRGKQSRKAADDAKQAKIAAEKKKKATAKAATRKTKGSLLKGLRSGALHRAVDKMEADEAAGLISTD